MNSVVVQYDFLKTKEESWKEEIEKNIISVKTSSDKVRRGMYAKLGDLQKKNMELEQRLSILEKYICTGS